MMYQVESLYILFLGVIAVVSILIKSLVRNTRWSPIPFYIIFGLTIRHIINALSLDSATLNETVRVFGDIGLILILFQVGVESKLSGLLKQIKNAFFISIIEVVISWLAMFIAFYSIFELPFQTALLISIAFTATSIAIAITPWRDCGLLKKKPGELIVDLSAMDDLAGITLMAIAFSIFSTYSVSETIDHLILLSVIWAVVKVFFLILVAYAFSVYVEPNLSRWIKKYEIAPDPVVTILCLALIFSSIAGFFGLSIALGSFLIGLSFSRDASAVRLLSSYQSLESFFIPFFFFSIGFSVSGLGSISLVAVGIIFIAALFGKVFGVGVPSYHLKLPKPISFLLGLGMVPRGEVTLVVIGYANHILDIPPKVYSECIIAVLITCFIPLLLKPLIKSQSIKH